MKIIFLTTSFPPYADSQTIRSLYLMHQLRDKVHEWIFIVPGGVSAGNVNLAGFESLLPENVRIIHTKAPWLLRLKFRLQNRFRSTLMQWTITNIIYYLSFPDQFMGWDQTAARTADKILRDEGADVIFSASGSPVAHIAAKKIKQKNNIPWVADYGDPWFFIDRSTRFWITPYSYFKEKSIIPYADHLVFTTAATFDQYKSWLGNKLPESTILPYGYHASDVADKGIKNSSPVLRFSHVGAAYVKDRNLLPLIHALTAVNKKDGRASNLEIGIIGNHSGKFDEAVAELGLGGIVKGRVSYQESLQFLSDTDILVVVGNKGGLQIPGKIFPYLATPRPLLYIRQRSPESDPCFQIIQGLPGIVVADNTEQALIQAVGEIVENISTLRLAAIQRINDDRLNQYSADNIGRKFSEIVQGLTNHPK